MEDNVKDVLLQIRKEYGLAIAQNVEKIYRLETANFTSGQFLGTFSAGMMKFASTFPYGWITVNNIIWKSKPEFAPIGVKSFKENVGLGGEGAGVKEFLQFRDLKSGMFTLAAFLQHYGNNAGRWYSTDLQRQSSYNETLSKMDTKYV